MDDAGSDLVVLGIALLLSLVPEPLVRLALAEAESLGDDANLVARPVRVLLKLVLQDRQLLLVLSLSSLNVASLIRVILGFL